MKTEEGERLITTPVLINELVYHDVAKMERTVGPLWKYMDQSLVPESDVTVLVREVKKEVTEDSQIGPSLHKHDVNQSYCLIGGIKLEVTLGAEKHFVEGPASILVPAGTEHAIRFAGGEGVLVNVLSRGSYE